MKLILKIIAFCMTAACTALAVAVFLDDHAMARRCYIRPDSDNIDME